jgi:Holliday junction DNA helicase RuvB
VGLKTLSAAPAEDIETIEDVYEPFLIRAGLLKRTTRGRVVTPAACKHVEREIPKGLELS